MSFVAIDELSHFSYEDAKILDFSAGEDVVFQLEALIVLPANSQNEQCTASYADVSVLRFIEGKIETIVLDGVKRYTADDVLLEEIPDRIISEPEMPGVLKSFKNAYLYGVESLGENEYVLGIDTSDGTVEGEISSPSYQVKISCKQAKVTWERYMNRVQMY